MEPTLRPPLRRPSYMGAAGAETTYFIGNLLEKVVTSGDQDYRHYIFAGNIKVAVFSRKQSGSFTRRYLREDDEMSKATIPLVAAVVISIALTIGLRQRSMGDADRTASSAIPLNENAVTHTVASVGDRRWPATRSATSEPVPRSPHLEKKAPLDSSEPLRKEGGNPEDSSSTAQGADPAAVINRDAPAPGVSRTTESTAIDPRSVIGQPFSVSASVTSGCKSVGCPEMDQMLSRFSQEPRDLAWASDMEAKLRDFVMTSRPEDTIRNVECRTSMCVIEVASANGPFVDGLSINSSSLRSLVLPGSAELGYESGSASARITVTIQPFIRR